MKKNEDFYSFDYELVKLKKKKMKKKKFHKIQF